VLIESPLAVATDIPLGGRGVSAEVDGAGCQVKFHEADPAVAAGVGVRDAVRTKRIPLVVGEDLIDAVAENVLVNSDVLPWYGGASDQLAYDPGLSSFPFTVGFHE